MHVGRPGRNLSSGQVSDDGGLEILGSCQIQQEYRYEAHKSYC